MHFNFALNKLMVLLLFGFGSVCDRTRFSFVSNKEKDNASLTIVVQYNQQWTLL